MMLSSRRSRSSPGIAISRLSALAVVALCAACSSGANRVVPATDSAASAHRATTAVSPSATAAPVLNVWPMYGYDTAHDGYNPNSTLFSDANVSSLRAIWHVRLGETGTQTQPIVATNIAGHNGILYVGGRSGIALAVDSGTGKTVWTRSFGTEQMQCVNKGPLLTLGMQASAVYDPVGGVVYMVDNTNASPNAPESVTIYKLDPATGNTLGSVNVTPTVLPGEIEFAHTGLTLANGTLYVGTSSTCDLSSWRGSISAVNVASMTVIDTFYPVYGQGGAYSGGGVWGWGGAAVDASGNVYIGAGNADYNAGKIGPEPPFARTTNEQVGYGEHLIALSSNLSTVESSYAVPYAFSPTERNLDLSGTPVLFTPQGCPTIVAVQGKAGSLNFYTAANIAAGPIGSFTFSVAEDDVSYIGNGTYSPLTGYYYANVPTSSGGSIRPPGMVAIGFAGCTPSIVWSAQFGADSYQIGKSDGQPRSAPTVTAGGIVLVGSPTANGTSQVWALDGSTGTILNSGNPIMTTGTLMRMPPVVDGKWMYVLDQGGNLYGYTI
jgi:outer membrane protein assembly factor BamB